MLNRELKHNVSPEIKKVAFFVHSIVLIPITIHQLNGVSLIEKENCIKKTNDALCCTAATQNEQKKNQKKSWMYFASPTNTLSQLPTFACGFFIFSRFSNAMQKSRTRAHAIKVM